MEGDSLLGATAGEPLPALRAGEALLSPLTVLSVTFLCCGWCCLVLLSPSLTFLFRLLPVPEEATPFLPPADPDLPLLLSSPDVIQHSLLLGFRVNLTQETKSAKKVWQSDVISSNYDNMRVNYLAACWSLPNLF